MSDIVISLVSAISSMSWFFCFIFSFFHIWLSLFLLIKARTYFVTSGKHNFCYLIFVVCFSFIGFLFLIMSFLQF